jgi:general secretion pathway protein G
MPADDAEQPGVGRSPMTDRADSVRLLVLVSAAGFLLGWASNEAVEAVRRTASSGPHGPADRTRFMLNMLEPKLELFRLHVGKYPTTAEGLDALLEPPRAALWAARWQGPYSRPGMLEDAWGNRFQYACPGRHNPETFDLWSTGGLPDPRDLWITNWRE